MCHFSTNWHFIGAFSKKVRVISFSLPLRVQLLCTLRGFLLIFLPVFLTVPCRCATIGRFGFQRVKKIRDGVFSSEQSQRCFLFLGVFLRLLLMMRKACIIKITI